MFVYIFLLLTLLIATYTDIKWRIIPIWLFPSVSLIIIMYKILCKQDIGWMNIVTFVAVFVSTLILGIIGSLGGADIIMFSCIGLIFGIEIIGYIIILAVISTIFIIIIRKKNIECPLAPFALISYVIFLIFCI